MTQYVFKEEFACPCCGEVKVNDRLLAIANLARNRAGIPFDIRNGSGYRCQKRNKDVGGKEDSAHMSGLAFDLPIRASRERWLAIEALIKFGINRIGLSESFIHVDIDSSKDPNVIWFY